MKLILRFFFLFLEKKNSLKHKHSRLFKNLALQVLAFLINFLYSCSSAAFFFTAKVAKQSKTLVLANFFYWALVFCFSFSTSLIRRYFFKWSHLKKAARQLDNSFFQLSSGPSTSSAALLDSCRFFFINEADCF